MGDVGTAHAFGTRLAVGGRIEPLKVSPAGDLTALANALGDLLNRGMQRDGECHGVALVGCNKITKRMVLPNRILMALQSNHRVTKLALK
jgi:hypothetical protein